MKQLLKQRGVRCTTAATALPTLTALLLAWALVEEENVAVRLALRKAMQCQEQGQEERSEQHACTKGGLRQGERNGPLSEWMLAEISVDLICQQIRGGYIAARYRACLPRLQRFLRSGHRRRPHLYSQVCRWLGTPMTSPEK